ncbi:hypothetical protein ABHW52_00320 [Pediococcus pentosaceus]
MEDLKNLTNQAVEKQPEIVKRFNEMIDSQHLSHAYLLTGAGGIGKKRRRSMGSDASFLY